MGSAARVVAVLLALLVASPFVLGEYAQQILSQAFFFSVAAVTVDILWGYTGILTFGQSAFFGVGVYTVALALAYYVGGALGTAAAVLAAMMAAALIGAAVGLKLTNATIMSRAARTIKFATLNTIFIIAPGWPGR